MEVLIFSYTRKQAIEDGVLRDLSSLARESGFRIPVAITEAAWRRCIEVAESDVCQDEIGRARDLLTVLYFAVRTSSSRDPLAFEVCVQDAPGRSETIPLKAILGPGDGGEPVVTVMFPEED